jgi:hypothetical protein
MKAEVTEQDYELLSRYLDGELDDAQARELRQRLLAEQDLRAVFERMKAVDGRLRDALDVAGADAVPVHVRQMVENAATRANPRGKRLGWGLGVAASVLFAAGVLMNVDQQGTPAGGGAQFAAQDALVAPVLERAPSRGEGWETLPDGSQVRALLSFPGVDGNWCREYLLAQDGREWRGVACRDSGDWVTAVLAVEKHAGVDGYRPAGATTPDQVASFIDSRAADIPLSREQEAALIGSGWE